MSEFVRALIDAMGYSLGTWLIYRCTRSFGAYTERVERASLLDRQSDEMTRQEIGRWREANEITLRALHKMRQDLINQRSA